MEGLVIEISCREIESAIKHMKNNKALDPSEIATEML
jgi:hypothetical protein